MAAVSVGVVVSECTMSTLWLVSWPDVHIIPLHCARVKPFRGANRSSTKQSKRRKMLRGTIT